MEKHMQWYYSQETGTFHERVPTGHVMNGTRYVVEHIPVERQVTVLSNKEAWQRIVDSNVDIESNVDVESNIDIAPCCCNCGYAKVLPSYWTREYDHAIPWVRGQWHKCRCSIGPKHEEIIKEEDSCPFFYCRF